MKTAGVAGRRLRARSSLSASSRLSQPARLEWETLAGDTSLMERKSQ
ncbi:Hypothetical Protein XCAW_01168 [Xanthomonas citri subsp. citri Aw12879]|nr:Hypothetical Protein XCAW_01168 [Xanthomonas citri subsp. citri Aw12879]